MADGFTATPVKGQRGNNGAAPASDGQLVLPAVANAAVPAYGEGNAVLLSTDLAGNLRVVMSGSGATTITGSVEVSNDAGNPLPVSGTVDLSAATLAALESIDLNPASLAALESIDLNAGTVAALQTIFVRGAVVSDVNPLPVLQQTNPGALVDTYLTSASLAAGASVDLEDAALTGALVGKLVEITADSSVRIKVELKSVTSANVATTKRTFFTDPTAAAVVYSPKDIDTLVAPALGHWRLTFTNLDTVNAANVYGSITRVEV